MSRKHPQLPILPLDEALSMPPAVFGRSNALYIENPTKTIRRTQNRLRVVFKNTPEITVEDAGILHEKSGVVFAKTRHKDLTYFVSCLTLNPKPIQQALPLEIITGICMFGAKALMGDTGDKLYDLTYPKDIQAIQEVITKIKVDDRLHLYEAETIARLSAFITNIWQQRAQAYTRVTFHLPVPEYIIYGLDLYCRGHMTATALANYIAAVKRKGKDLEALLRQKFTESTIKLELNSPLSWINDMTFQHLEPKEIPAQLYAIAAKQNALWKAIIDLHTDRRLLDLNHLSYMYQYLSAAQRTQAAGSQLVLVENPEELPIYLNAKKLQPKLGIKLDKAAMLYIHPKVMVTKKAYADHGSFLYYCLDGFNEQAIQLATQPYTTIKR